MRTANSGPAQCGDPTSSTAFETFRLPATSAMCREVHQNLVALVLANVPCTEARRELRHEFPPIHEPRENFHTHMAWSTQQLMPAAWAHHGSLRYKLTLLGLSWNSNTVSPRNSRPRLRSALHAKKIAALCAFRPKRPWQVKSTSATILCRTRPLQAQSLPRSRPCLLQAL